MDSFDPAFLRQVSGAGPIAHYVFLSLAVLNLVAGFHALGTLMAVGIMILPAAGARFWSKSIGGMIGAAMLIGAVSSLVGLLVSFHVDTPTGPTIILAAGLIYLISVAFGRHGSLFANRAASVRG